MKRIYVLTMVIGVGAVCHCGGGAVTPEVSESASVVVLKSSMFFPKTMASVDQKEILVSLSLQNDQPLPVATSVQASVVSDQWHWTLNSVPDGGYNAHLTYMIGEIPVAVARVPSSIVNGIGKLTIQDGHFENAGGGDLDGDGLSNLDELLNGTNPAKADTDGDGVNDKLDAFPLDPKENKDTDGDGVGNNADNCPLVPNANQADVDHDGIGDVCDEVNDDIQDTDGDGVIDKLDAFPLDPSEVKDTDGDGVGDHKDNCSDVFNPDQVNTDQILKKAGTIVTGQQQVKEDGLGDACDDDPDGDGRNVVYLDSNMGSDSATGYFKSPVKTIARALLLAHAQKSSVWLASGDYGVGNVIWLKGAQLFGGYDADFNPATRDFSGSSKSATRFLAPGKSSVLLLQNLSTDTRFDGIHVIADSMASVSSAAVVIDNSVVTISNCIIAGSPQSNNDTAVQVQNNGFATVDGSSLKAGGHASGVESTGVWVKQSTLNMVKSIIAAGNAPHATAARLESATTTIDQSTLLAQTNPKTQQRATGVWLVATKPKITQSVITVSGAQVEGIYFEKENLSPTGVVIKNSTISAGGAPNPLLRDWKGVPYTSVINGDFQAVFPGGEKQTFSDLIGAGNSSGNAMGTP